jgi:hypothetical protein
MDSALSTLHAFICFDARRPQTGPARLQEQAYSIWRSAFASSDLPLAPWLVAREPDLVNHLTQGARARNQEIETLENGFRDMTKAAYRFAVG